MAVTLSPDAQLVFFNSVMGPHSVTTVNVKGLLKNGVTFEVSLYGLRAFPKGKPSEAKTLTLTYGTTALMKGSVTPEVLTQNRKLIETWIAGLMVWCANGILDAQQQSFTPPSLKHRVVLLGTHAALGSLLILIKAILKTGTAGGSLTGHLPSLKEAKQMAEYAAQGVVVEIGVFSTLQAAQEAAQLLIEAGGVVKVEDVLETEKPSLSTKAALAGPPVAATPVNQVIHLKEAKALGQKVHGTSAGSVYHTIALTDHVKVAARIYKSGSISIRAEWTDNPTTDLQRLEDSGLQMKSHAQYGSIHFDANGVPLQRVIGAFLMGTGINWKAAVSNGSELVVAES